MTVSADTAIASHNLGSPTTALAATKTIVYVGSDQAGIDKLKELTDDDGYTLTVVPRFIDARDLCYKEPQPLAVVFDPRLNAPHEYPHLDGYSFSKGLAGSLTGSFVRQIVWPLNCSGADQQRFHAAMADVRYVPRDIDGRSDRRALLDALDFSGPPMQRRR